MLRHYKIRKFIAILTLLSITGSFVPLALADTASEIQSRINTKNDEIKRLEEEIKQYQNSLDQTAGQAKSLQNELKALNLSKQKLQTELKATEANLSKTTATITQIVGEINKTENSIEDKRLKIALTLRNLRDTGDRGLVEAILSNESLAEISDYMENSIKLTDALRGVIGELQNDEAVLASKKTEEHSWN